MNVFVVLAILILSVWTLIMRNFVKDYAKKSRFTLVVLPILVILSGVVAITSKIQRISIAWWLMALIFIVLLISTIMSYVQWKKTNDIETEKEPETETETETQVQAEGKNKGEASGTSEDQPENNIPPAPPAM